MNSYVKHDKPISESVARMMRFDERFMLGCRCPASEKQEENNVNIQTYYLKTRKGMNQYERYNPSADLAMCDKSILSMFVGNRSSINIEGFSPLDAVAFMEGICEGIKDRKKLFNKRIFKASVTLFIPRAPAEAASAPPSGASTRRPPYRPAQTLQ